MLKKYFPKSEFVRNVLTLMTGTAIAQIIPISISPLLTRLYSPVDFGGYELFARMIGILSVAATGRYDMAIMLPAKKGDAFSLVVLCGLISLFLSVALFLVIFLFNEFFLKIFNVPDAYSFLVYFVPIYVLFIGLNQAYTNWNNRKKRFKTQALAKIMQHAGLAMVTLTLGYMKLGTEGLIIGAIFGTIVSIVIFYIDNYREDKELFVLVRKETMISQAKRYGDFPKINLLHALGDNVLAWLQVFLIAAYFNREVLGLYSFGLRLIQTPLGLIGKSISMVFYQQASQRYARGEDIYLMTTKLLKRMFFLGVPFFFILFFFAGDVFAFIFGKQWREAGDFVQILSPWLCLSFASSVIAQIPIIVNKQRSAFFLSLICGALFVLSILYGGGVAKNIKNCLIAISVSQVIYFSVEIYWFLRIIKNKKIIFEGE